MPSFNVSLWPDATFLLQANDYTVEIDKKEGLEDSVDTMELTLLTTQRAHERLKTYNAPSATDIPWPYTFVYCLSFLPFVPKQKLFITDDIKEIKITQRLSMLFYLGILVS